jgi:hypothetical protein
MPAFLQLLDFLELRGLSYIIVARLARWLKREAMRHRLARSGSTLQGGEFSLQLPGRNRPRRFVVIREQLRAEHASLGRKLLEVPGYIFRVRARFLSRAAPGW